MTQLHIGNEMTIRKTSAPCQHGGSMQIFYNMLCSVHVICFIWRFNCVFHLNALLLSHFTSICRRCCQQLLFTDSTPIHNKPPRASIGCLKITPGYLMHAETALNLHPRYLGTPVDPAGPGYLRQPEPQGPGPGARVPKATHPRPLTADPRSKVGGPPRLHLRPSIEGRWSKKVDHLPFIEGRSDVDNNYRLPE